MRTIVFLSLFSLVGLVSGCDSKIEELESQRPTSNITTTDTNGVVTGTISATATSDQIMVASPHAKAADSSITFPPGSLAIETSISIGDAVDSSSSILTELGVSPLATASSPVYIAPSSGTPPNIEKPLVLQLPLPLNLGTTALADGVTSKLALLYVIYQNGWKSGLLPLTSENFVGAFLKKTIDGLGYFQIVYLPTAVAEVAAGTSSIVPSLDTVDDDKDETDEHKEGSDAVTCTGDASGALAGTYAYVKGCRLYKRNASASNSNCPYSINDVMNVGVNGDGALSLLDTNSGKASGLLELDYPMPVSTTTEVRWSVTDATGYTRWDVKAIFDAGSPNAPLTSDALKIVMYNGNTAAATCYFNYDSDL